MQPVLPPPNPDYQLEALIDFLERSKRLLVFTGAGCSTDSDIPDYRNKNGEWKHKPPIFYQDFMHKEEVCKRYWARSILGWERIAHAQPNPTHLALARLEAEG